MPANKDSASSVMEKNSTVITEQVKSLREGAVQNGLKMRLDDDYLYRFLNGHKYDVPCALKAIKNYDSFVERRREKWLKINPHLLKTILDSGVIDVWENVGQRGQKIVWMRVGKWDPSLYSADEILEASGVLCELVFANSGLVKSFDMIIDLANFSFKHLYALSPKFAKRMIFFIAECLPMKLATIYVIRQPRMFYLIFAIFKPFLEERMQKIILFCGNDFSNLNDRIGQEVLPEELGGRGKIAMSQRWFNILCEPRILNEIKKSGYQIDESQLLTAV